MSAPFPIGCKVRLTAAYRHKLKQARLYYERYDAHPGTLTAYFKPSVAVVDFPHASGRLVHVDNLELTP